MTAQDGSIFDHLSQAVVPPFNGAVGQEWSWQAPQPCRVLAIRAILATSAVPGTRTPGLEVAFGNTGDLTWLFVGITGIGPSSQGQVSYIPGSGFYGPNSVEGAISIPAPDYVLVQNSVITSRTPSLDAGDQYQQICILIET